MRVTDAAIKIALVNAKNENDAVVVDGHLYFLFILQSLIGRYCIHL